MAERTCSGPVRSTSLDSGHAATDTAAPVRAMFTFGPNHTAIDAPMHLVWAMTPSGLRSAWVPRDIGVGDFEG